MKTDKFFYRFFLSRPELISELLPGIPADCQFDYSAPVIKEKEFRLDGLLTPISDNFSLPLIFLEAQMQSDQGFYGRYFGSIYLYLQQYAINRPWRGLVIIHRRSQNLGSEIPYQLLLENQVQRFYLEDLIPWVNLDINLALLRLVVLPTSDIQGAAQSILQSAKTQAEFIQCLDLIEVILINKFPQLTTEELLRMLDLTTVDVTQTRFYQDVFQAGEVNLVLRLLTRLCGSLSEDQVSQIRGLSLDRLEELAEALLNFEGLSDLDGWLRSHV